MKKPPFIEADDVDGKVEEAHGGYVRITARELLRHLAYERKRQKLFLIWKWRGRIGRPPK